MEYDGVWIFNGNGTHHWFPSGVFRTLELAVKWIAKHKLSGTLTKYPFDTGVYEWAIQHKFFKVRKPEQSTPEFIGRFSAAQQDHYHFDDGDCSALEVQEILQLLENCAGGDARAQGE